MSSLEIPFGTRVAVTTLPGAKPIRGTCQGREFGDPTAPGKHFVQLDSGGRGCYWDVRRLTDVEAAEERAALERVLYD